MGIDRVAAFVGGACGLLMVFKASILGDPPHGYSTPVSVITLIGGIQPIAIGIVGEYVGKTYIEVKQCPNYLVQEDTQARHTTNPHPGARVREAAYAPAS